MHPKDLPPTSPNGAKLSFSGQDFRVIAGQWYSAPAKFVESSYQHWRLCRVIQQHQLYLMYNDRKKVSEVVLHVE